MINFEIVHPQCSPEALGFIPAFINEDDPRSAAQQIEDRYCFGGGWSPLEGFRRCSGPSEFSIKYPGDPMKIVLAKAQLRDETIVVYDGAWVGIFQKDGSFEVSRLD